MTDLTLDQAQDILFNHIEEGTECLCCGQFAKVYKRPIYSTLAVQLIQFYKIHRREWGNLPDTPDMLAKSSGGGDFAKLRYWGLIEEHPDEIRSDGSPRAGWWRVTELGEGFVKGTRQVEKMALVYNGECLKLEGKKTYITGCLGKGFVYRELMAA